MTLEEYIFKYDKLSVKEMTKIFNELSVNDRIEFLSVLPDSDKKKFIKDIRSQAVKDFWYHEREAILNGKSTRDWTPEQIESIMKINENTGEMSVNAGKAVVVDENGKVLVDVNGNESYYGHHMIDVSTHPEYAGDWRNIQALDYDEHYYGAHQNHDTKTPTIGYYDVESKTTVEIDATADGFSFDDLE